MFSRIAVVNRGEAAVRLLHAVRELNAETGSATEVVALHTTGERTAMFVREADTAYDLGPASARPYIDHAVLERALRETRADAAWVGWGFVAEDPTFAELCERIGVTFVGPSPEAMRRLGDKIGAKLLAEEVGVPVAAWSGGDVPDLESALAQAKRIGYPLMLKATAGGGGRGIRMLHSDDELRDVFTRTREEAQRSFGSGVVFLERLVSGARHIEVQVIADGQGTAWALGVRDCSIQRRNQKLLEESASPVLAPSQVEHVKGAAERLALAVGYCGAGTVEFLYHPGEKSFAFLEVNTRLQVEHPVTEVATGVDLVKAQLHVAAGGRLHGSPPPEIGHAIEARLNAEDPDQDFAPAPGRIVLFSPASGPGVRIDTGVAEGDSIPADFDSMIAKVIAHGRTREEAIARLRRALAETTVVIDGGTTNKSFLLDLLGRPEVLDGSADTGWIDRVRATGGLVARRGAGIALLMAAVEAYEQEEQVERQRFLTTAHGGRPQARHVEERVVELTLRGAVHRVAVAKVAARRYVLGVEEGEQVRTVEADVERLGAHAARLLVGGRTFHVVSATSGPMHLVEVDATTHRVSREEGGVLRSPAPALVVALPVEVGAEVEAGAAVLVLESMKMETVLVAPVASRVRELLVGVGGQVETGSPLMRLEPLGEAGAAEVKPDAEAEAALELPDTPEETPEQRAERALDRVRAFLLGFDVTPAQARSSLADHGITRAGLPDQGALLGHELAVLTAFADLAELARNRSAAGDDETDRTERVHSPREHFHAYLHSLDVDREGLPETFRARLARVVRHYGVTELDRGPELEEAVFRTFLAQQRITSHVPVLTALLDRWLRDDAPAEQLRDDAREALDRLVRATQLRFPEIAELARSVRFRWFDQPAVDASRAATYARVEESLERLVRDPGVPDRDERVEELVGIPEQIVRFLAAHLEKGVPENEPMLEVLIRRYYREFELHDLRSLAIDGRPFAVADYVLDERPTHLVTTVAQMSELDRAAGAIATQVEAAPEGSQAVVDLYLRWPEVPEGHDEAVGVLGAAFGALPFARRVRRIAVAVCPGGEAAIRYYTLRPSPTDSTGMSEDDLVRGVHPMVGRRLDLWRLRDFAIRRLDAPEDVLLYHCVAPANPSDQRLVALAQVRELTVVRDRAGHVTSLPQVERAVAGCLDAIRRARAAAGPSAGLDRNHVLLHIWPRIDAPLEELTALQDTVAPMTAGAGIEEVVVQGRVATPQGEVTAAARFAYQPGAGVVATVTGPPTERIAPLDDYAQKALRSRRRGTVYPYELVPLVAGEGGSFDELDLDDTGEALVAVDRPAGRNKAGIVVGRVRTPSARYPEGMERVALLGDPTRALGAVAEAECARVVAALDLAEALHVPVEWYALSAGARISMDSGTENMDWVARALRRIITFTQAGGEVNVVVAGINVGAQPYWNAEATMLMHTRGILVMTPDSAMVLTGKQSLDYSGGVSAEDNFGIGGYDRVMGPNGQAQYWAPDLAGACAVLQAHYEHTYVAPGEDGPRVAATTDPVDRDVRDFPHVVEGSDFRTVGDVFSATANPDRKKAFDVRTVMRAVADQDHRVLERWAGMADAETAVVLDAHLGGRPVCLLGIESKPVPRRGFPPSDGPDTWTAGTLFPRSSKKAARAINAASGIQPLVVLANLSGFDGSPDSMRNLQLEYGAEIGRAVVNFRGPIVFCVVSRYHGGAFVVFSKALNPSMTVLAVEGSFASVIGGAPAAAVVFAGEVDARTAADPRVAELAARLKDADDVTRARLGAELAELRANVRSEKLGQVAAEFDRVHSIHRAVEVGSVDAVIEAAELRPRLVEAVERGLAQP